MSGHHATITPNSNGEFILEDLNSTNGTRIDGSAVMGRTALRDGDKIFVGETVIRFSLSLITAAAAALYRAKAQGKNCVTT